MNAFCLYGSNTPGERGVQEFLVENLQAVGYTVWERQTDLREGIEMSWIVVRDVQTGFLADDFFLRHAEARVMLIHSAANPFRPILRLTKEQGSQLVELDLPRDAGKFKGIITPTSAVVA